MSILDLPKKTPRKKPPRYTGLSGYVGKPRGRHTNHPADTERETIIVPPERRLGFRIPEFAALLNVSAPTIWRGIKKGEIEIAIINGMRIVTRAYAIKVGLIKKDDKI
jgi:hypothetical protein